MVIFHCYVSSPEGIPICLVRWVIIDHIYGTGNDIFTIHEIYLHHDILSGISNFFFRPQKSPPILGRLALSPVMLAFWIAASRVRENDHHPADVVTGACIGSAWEPR